MFFFDALGLKLKDLDVYVISNLVTTSGREWYINNFCNIHKPKYIDSSASKINCPFEVIFFYIIFGNIFLNKK